jgi:hypothetical protein
LGHLGGFIVKAPEPDVACREVILSWSRLPELARFAQLRHGYENSDGGFGVTYPDDLDEFQRQVEGVQIPYGSLLVYGFANAPPYGYELLLREHYYLTVLADILSEAGHANEAATVRSLAGGSERVA